MPTPPCQFDSVRVVCLRDDRFVGAAVFHERHPKVGDVGYVLEIYSSPTIEYEVECVDPKTGCAIWLNAMYPDEIELVQHVTDGTA